MFVLWISYKLPVREEFWYLFYIWTELRFEYNIAVLYCIAVLQGDVKVFVIYNCLLHFNVSYIIINGDLQCTWRNNKDSTTVSVKELLLKYENWRIISKYPNNSIWNDLMISVFLLKHNLFMKCLSWSS